MLAATQYKFRHDQVAKYIHWCILRNLKAKIPENWTKHEPEKIYTNEEVTVMWDMAIETDKKCKANRPDITIHQKKLRECTFVDITIPVCTNVIKKEAEKITKYRDLEIETQKCWNLKKIRTIPIVVGALGTVCKNISKRIETISPSVEFKIIQKTALLGSAHILRNFLTPYQAEPEENKQQHDNPSAPPDLETHPAHTSIPIYGKVNP